MDTKTIFDRTQHWVSYFSRKFPLRGNPIMQNKPTFPMYFPKLDSLAAEDQFISAQDLTPIQYSDAIAKIEHAYSCAINFLNIGDNTHTITLEEDGISLGMELGDLKISGDKLIETGIYAVAEVILNIECFRKGCNHPIQPAIGGGQMFFFLFKNDDIFPTANPKTVARAIKCVKQYKGESGVDAFLDIMESYGQ